MNDIRIHRTWGGVALLGVAAICRAYDVAGGVIWLIAIVGLLAIVSGFANEQ